MRELRAGDLRTGEKIDQLHVDWMSTRRRDEPLTEDESPSSHMINNDKQMISGQLLIFELDEEPPEVKAELTTSTSTSHNTAKLVKLVSLSLKLISIEGSLISIFCREEFSPRKFILVSLSFIVVLVSILSMHVAHDKLFKNFIWQYNKFFS
ncbi:unnamed protein product [Angiostrongylus costaricensis]|uniref:Transmembrane protein n=1 Tax=Angiostrongylus costaricensis TaxID=334426 RepID=A0A0R3PX36_ANGCS|nr:unnamed protein product [Angiostrongylus costaricensis]